MKEEEQESDLDAFGGECDPELADGSGFPTSYFEKGLIEWSAKTWEAQAYLICSAGRERLGPRPHRPEASYKPENATQQRPNPQTVGQTKQPPPGRSHEPDAIQVRVWTMPSS